MFTTNNLINYFSVNNLNGVMIKSQNKFEDFIKSKKIDLLKVSIKVRKNRKVTFETETKIRKE